MCRTLPCTRNTGMTHKVRQYVHVMYVSGACLHVFITCMYMCITCRQQIAVKVHTNGHTQLQGAEECNLDQQHDTILQYKIHTLYMYFTPCTHNVHVSYT